MSAKSLIAFAGLSKFRARLAVAYEGLRQAKAGEVLDRAVAKVATQVRTVAAKKLADHKMSGTAASDTVVDVTGGLVQLHGMPPCDGEGWQGKSYLSTFAWWPFRSGYMPPFVIRNAAQIFEAELVAALNGTRSPILLAEEAEEEASAEKSRATFRKEVARIYRQSAEGLAKSKAKRDAGTKQRAAERAYDRKIKRLER